MSQRVPFLSLHCLPLSPGLISTSFLVFFSQYFKYDFPDGVDTVVVKVNSDMNFPCSVMSIQDIQVRFVRTRPGQAEACSDT